MIENYYFIQLPPIKKDTPSEVVSMIWQYLKLPEESRKRVKADRKSTRLNSSHIQKDRMPSSA